MQTEAWNGGDRKTSEAAAAASAPFIAIRTTPSSMASPKLRTLLTYWSGKRQDQPVPLRKDILPDEIPSLLSHIGLVDVEGVPFRYRFRLLGANVDYSQLGMRSGRYLDEISPRIIADDLAGHYHEVVATGIPAVYRMQLESSLTLFTFEGLILPLSTDGDRIDMLLIGSDRPAIPREFFDRHRRPASV